MRLPVWLSTEDAAGALGMELRYLARLARNGDLPAEKFKGSRLWWVRPHTVCDFFKVSMDELESRWAAWERSKRKHLTKAKGAEHDSPKVVGLKRKPPHG
jgi:hypothetical protein